MKKIIKELLERIYPVKEPDVGFYFLFTRMHTLLNIEKGSIRVNDYRKSECDVEVFILLLLQHNSYSSNIIHYCWAIESSI